MCGIAGYLNLDSAPASEQVIKLMTDAIAHRGPDGEGFWVKDSVALGHRRLAIIDLSVAASQPMVSSSGHLILTYNGEIYNFRELRSELMELGVLFSSESDTEVVLRSIEKWGKGALLRFNGMFAFALWNTQTQKLLLGRDRYGVKPLYFAKQGTHFFFGSEQKAITAHPKFMKALNEPALLEYFTFQNLLSNSTLMKDVTTLEAGSWMELDLYRGQHTQGRYWDYDFRESPLIVSQAEAQEELGRLFRQAVNRQLISDVEVGSYLSGGMDSGSIAAVASQTIPNLKTFTCGFDLSSASGLELAYDERDRAEAMSSQLRTEQYEMVLKSGDMERCLPNLAWHLEEPRVGQSYPNYYASKLASKFVKVVLAGSGGDELFAGYPWRYYRAANAVSFDDYIDKYYVFWQRLLSNAELRKVFDPIWGSVSGVWTRDIFKSVFREQGDVPRDPEEFINLSLYFEAKTFLHGLFVVEDKLAMAHGLESRVPFMDNDLVDFAMACPVRFKLRDLLKVTKLDENQPGNKKEIQFEKTNDGKQILREVMRDYLPDKITTAVKQGFSSPDASWFKGDSIDFVQRRLLNKNAVLYNFLDFKAVAPLIGEHMDGKRNRRLLIWSLLNVEEYLRTQL